MWQQQHSHSVYVCVCVEWKTASVLNIFILCSFFTLYLGQNIINNDEEMSYGADAELGFFAQYEQPTIYVRCVYVWVS